MWTVEFVRVNTPVSTTIQNRSVQCPFSPHNDPTSSYYKHNAESRGCREAVTLRVTSLVPWPGSWHSEDWRERDCIDQLWDSIVDWSVVICWAVCEEYLPSYPFSAMSVYWGLFWNVYFFMRAFWSEANVGTVWVIVMSYTLLAMWAPAQLSDPLLLIYLVHIPEVRH